MLSLDPSFFSDPAAPLAPLGSLFLNLFGVSGVLVDPPAVPDVLLGVALCIDVAFRRDWREGSSSRKE